MGAPLAQPIEKPPRPVTQHDLEQLHRLIQQQGDNQGVLLNSIIDSILGFRMRDNIDEVIYVISAQRTLSRKGRRHNWLWCNATQTTLIDNLTGNVSFSLHAGWNILDLAEGARISVAAGSEFTALYRCTDFEASGAII